MKSSFSNICIHMQFFFFNKHVEFPPYLSLLTPVFNIKILNFQIVIEYDIKLNSANSEKYNTSTNHLPMTWQLTYITLYKQITYTFIIYLTHNLHPSHWYKWHLLFLCCAQYWKIKFTSINTCTPCYIHYRYVHNWMRNPLLHILVVLDCLQLLDDIPLFWTINSLRGRLIWTTL